MTDQVSPQVADQETIDVSRQVSSVVKAFAGSSQLSDVSTSFGVDTGNLVIDPPVDPSELWALTELNPYHGACIGAKATDAFGRGWSVYRQDEQEAELTDQVRRFLNGITAKGWTFARLWRETGRELDAIGYALIEVTRDEQDQINGLFPLPAQTFRVAKIGVDEDGNVTKETGDFGKVWVQKREERHRYFVRFAADREGQPVLSRETGDELADGADASLRATEVLPVIFPSPRSSYYGVPDWISASGPVSELASIRAFREAYFDSNGMVDQIVHVKAETEKVATALKDEIVRQFHQVKGRQHVKVFVASDNSVEIEVQPLSPMARGGDVDSGFSEGKEDNVREVLVAHQVPPYRIGWAELGSLGGSTAKEMLEAYRWGVIEPRQDLGQGAISELLEDQSFSDLGLQDGDEIRFDDIDWDAFEQELELANDGVDRGAMNRDEWRQTMGQEPTGLPQMQEYLVGGKPLGQDAESMLEAFQQELRAASGETDQEDEADSE